jgi:hypothetical protein
MWIGFIGLRSGFNVWLLLNVFKTDAKNCIFTFYVKSSSIPALPEKKVVGLERGPLSLVSTTEELLDRKVAAPV